jgi:Uma2 family endonuclease
MTQAVIIKRWTTKDLETDLETLPYDEWNRYEIIDGELFVTKVPHFRHQKVATNLICQIQRWSDETNLGAIVATPGLIYSDSDNVIPDLVWVSNSRLSELLDDSGHFQGSPELIIEVLSYGKEDKRRDRDVKLKLYSREQVMEYWIVDWRHEQIEIYRPDNSGSLTLERILSKNDELTSGILLGFICSLSEIFI